MSATRPPDRSFVCNRTGSALVVTLLVISLLIVMVLAFVAGVRMELRQVVSHQNHMQALANARLGAEMALGELQRHLGPDRRVSAPSNIGLGSGAHAAYPHITGTWENAPTGSGGLGAQSYSPSLVGWLLSGNEGRGPGDSGYVTPANVRTRTPGLDPNTAWLVNTGSVVPPATPSESTPDTRIHAPLVQISSAGRYAWWVGDEGVKASVSLPDPSGNAAPPPSILSGRKHRFDLMSTLSPFRAVMNTPVLDILNSPGELFSDFPPFDALGLGNPAQRDLLRRSHFHHLAHHTESLLTDTRNGGLRQDLSYLFSLNADQMRQALNSMYRDVNLNPGFQTGAGSVNPLIRPGVTVPNWVPSFPVTSQGRSIGPTWEQLHSFANTWRDLQTHNGAAVLGPRTQLSTRQGYSPVLVQAKMFYGMRREATANPNEFELYTHFFPLFVLANPYDVDLAPATYVVTIRFPQNSTIYYRVMTGDPVTYHNVAVKNHWNYTSFRLVMTSPLPAGMARAFSLEFNQPANSWDSGSLSYEYTTGGTYKMVDDFSDLVSLRRRVPGLFPGVDSANPSLRVHGQANLSAILWTDQPGDYTTVYKAWGNETPATDDLIMPANLTTPGDVVMLGGHQQRWPDQRDYDGANIHNSLFGEFNMRAASQKASQGGVSPDTQNRVPAMVNGRILRSNPSFFFGVNGWLTIAPDNTSAPWLINHQLHSTSSALNYQNLLYHVPREPLSSPGQLQHFDPSGFLNDDSGGMTGRFEDKNVNTPTHSSFNSFAYQTSYAIGNSRASRYVPRDQLEYAGSAGTHRDTSYLLNILLWDRFYVSTIGYGGGSVSFGDPGILGKNRRLRPVKSAAPVISQASLQPSTPAAHLVLTGGFNVNSTSVEAWKAMLGAMLGVEFNGESNTNEIPFPRSPNVTGGSGASNNGSSENAWTGFRKLTESELQRLAESVVAQVRLRGPFLSLSDFVNRRLVSASAENALPAVQRVGVNGALEAAIVNAGLNSVTGRYGLAPPNRSNSTVDSAHSVPHISSHFPGWLTQADLLQPLGPMLTSRSDTFRVRAYGEHNGSKAWCELLVRRIPEFLDPAQPAADTPVPLLYPLNQRFGRAFEIVSFRWLSREEI